MAREISRGEIWTYAFGAPDNRRPVLVLTRHEVISLLHTVMVAPITSTIHGAQSEVIVGTDEGLKRDSAVNLDHVQTVEQARLTRGLGREPDQNAGRMPGPGDRGRLRRLTPHDGENGSLEALGS